MKQDRALISPHNQDELVEKSPNLLSDGEFLWPVIDGIAYLREKHELRDKAVFYIQKNKLEKALLLLLKDQDSFAPLPPPEDVAVLKVIEQKPGFLNSMRLLNYGPVTEYFAHRTSAPTFLTGLALLQLGAESNRPVLEIACGVGHYLRTLEGNGFEASGVDLVFSKLWLARKYMQVKGQLICCDIAKSPVLKNDELVTVFCHDAFYFFDEKEKILKSLRKLCNGGSLILGHVHTNAVDHGVSGYPISVLNYMAIAADNSRYYIDNELVNYWFSRDRNALDENPKKENTDVISWIENAPDDTQIFLDQPAASLYLNPMLEDTGAGLRIKWPTHGYQEEYQADMHYLNKAELGRLSANTVQKAAGEKRQEYFKKRILLDTPRL